MKIGFFTDYYLPVINGVSISVDQFRKALEKQGHTVYVFCPKYPHTPKQESPHIIRFNSTPGLWYDNYRDTFPWTTKNVNFIKSLKLDIIHLHTGAQIGILGLRISKEEGIPNIQTYHTDVVGYSKIYKLLPIASAALLLIGKMNIKNTLSFREIFKVFKPSQDKKTVYSQKIVQEVATILFSLNDLIIAPSARVKKMIKSYGVTQPIEIIPTGLDLDEIKHAQAIPSQLTKQLQGSRPHLLYVGRLGAEKNCQLIIRSLAQLTDRYHDIRLIIVGSGPYEHELKRLAEELNVARHLIFTGWLEHSSVLNIYKYADIFVFPSTTDTQGLVVNEAFASKLPVVFCDDQISELLQDGKTGLKAKSTASDLAAKIADLLDHPAKAQDFAQTGFKLTRALNIDEQAKKLAHIYQSVSKQGRKP